PIAPLYRPLSMPTEASSPHRSPSSSKRLRLARTLPARLRRRRTKQLRIASKLPTKLLSKPILNDINEGRSISFDPVSLLVFAPMNKRDAALDNRQDFLV